MRKPGVHVYATVSQKSSSDDHVTVASRVQADGGVNLHIADFDSISVQKKNY
jgi:hypothetical protein